VGTLHGEPTPTTTTDALELLREQAVLPNPTFDLLLSLGKSGIEKDILNLCFFAQPIARLPTHYSPHSFRAFGRPTSRIF
jgi:hypothetical protein